MKCCFHYNNLLLGFVIACTALLSACATQQEPDPAQIQQRKLALHSWVTCLKQAPATSLGVSDLRSRHRERILACQGHEFDLVATYPRHMKPTLDRVIEQSAQQVLLGQARPTDTLLDIRQSNIRRPLNNSWRGIMNSGSQPRMNSLAKPPG